MLAYSPSRINKDAFVVQRPLHWQTTQLKPGRFTLRSRCTRALYVACRLGPSLPTKRARPVQEADWRLSSAVIESGRPRSGFVWEFVGVSVEEECGRCEASLCLLRKLSFGLAAQTYRAEVVQFDLQRRLSTEVTFQPSFTAATQSASSA
jgi:hypothetical protein